MKVEVIDGEKVVHLNEIDVGAMRKLLRRAFDSEMLFEEEEWATLEVLYAELGKAK